MARTVRAELIRLTRAAEAVRKQFMGRSRNCFSRHRSVLKQSEIPLGPRQGMEERLLPFAQRRNRMGDFAVDKVNIGRLVAAAEPQLSGSFGQDAQLKNVGQTDL